MLFFRASRNLLAAIANSNKLSSSSLESSLLSRSGSCDVGLAGSSSPSWCRSSRPVGVLVLLVDDTMHSPPWSFLSDTTGSIFGFPSVCGQEEVIVLAKEGTGEDDGPMSIMLIVVLLIPLDAMLYLLLLWVPFFLLKLSRRTPIHKDGILRTMRGWRYAPFSSEARSRTMRNP